MQSRTARLLWILPTTYMLHSSMLTLLQMMAPLVLLWMAQEATVLPQIPGLSCQATRISSSKTCCMLKAVLQQSGLTLLIAAPTTEVHPSLLIQPRAKWLHRVVLAATAAEPLSQQKQHQLLRLLQQLCKQPYKNSTSSSSYHSKPQ